MASGRLTVVMYHYVRPVAESAWPRIKGLELARFRGQLDYIQRHYTPVSMDRVVEAAAGDGLLPANAILLTFDDGYADHYQFVFPELAARGLSGAFFLPACALIDRKVLDVNRIHYILAAVTEPDLLAVHVDRAVLDAAGEFDLPAPSVLREATKGVNRWDPPEVAYVKRMLQDGLPAPLRRRLIDELFARFVTRDTATFSEDLYLTVDQAREMIDGGMHVGSHGESHERLGLMDAKQQRQEIANSLRIFPAVGRPAQGFTFCYPYGSHDRHTVHILRELGCRAAVTTRVALAEAAPSAILELPRIDTNDLPGARDAAPTEWTRAAMA